MTVGAKDVRDYIYDRLETLEEVRETFIYWVTRWIKELIYSVQEKLRDIYLAPELEWKLFWSRWTTSSSSRTMTAAPKETALMTGPTVVTDDQLLLTLRAAERREKLYQVAKSMPVDSRGQLQRMEREAAKIANDAIISTRRLVLATQAEWLHTIHIIHQHALNILMDAAVDPCDSLGPSSAAVADASSSSSRSLYKGLERQIRQYIVETYTATSRQYERLRKSIYRRYYYAGLTALKGSSPLNPLFDQLQHETLGYVSSKHRQGLASLSYEAHRFADTVLDTIRTSLSADTCNDHQEHHDINVFYNDDNALLFGFNHSTYSAKATMLRTALQSGIKRVDSDLTTVVKACTSITRKLELDMCNAWKLATDQVKNPDNFWLLLLLRIWDICTFVFRMTFKYIVSFV